MMRARLKAFFQPQTAGVTAPWRVFWAALGVRLAFMTLAHTYRFHNRGELFDFGYEAGRIASALASGRGYADPFSNIVVRHTGPTAWLPPLYPLLLAAVFRLFGIYTHLSGWVILAINSVFSALTAMSVWELGCRFAGRRCGLWAGWLWALHPAAMQYATKWVWEMTLTTALFTWVLVLSLRMRESAVQGESQTRHWLLFGLLWGLIALSNSTLLLFLPVLGLWVLAATRWRAGGALLAGLVFLACITPWTVRNYHVFHKFIPMRGNFGVELYLGNGPGATGFLMEYNHPFLAADQLRLYAKMGEVKYVAMRGAAARAVIEADPGHFVADSLLRVYFFWAGLPHSSDESAGAEAGRLLNHAFISLCGFFGLALAIARGKEGAWVLAGAFLLLPLPYYLVTAHARFRHPLEPIICVLAVYLFQSAEPKKA